MNVLSFTDILKKAGLDPKRVKLFRHSMSSEQFKPCFEKNMIQEYTAVQSVGFGKDYDYWAVFISDRGTLAKFYALYKVNGSQPSTKDVMPEGFPHEDWFDGKSEYFDLEPLDLLQEYEKRLIIDWGRGTLAWPQKGTNEKPVIAISPDERRVFAGFENLILSYDELKEIIENKQVYEAWHTALASVNAIYLIVDRSTGRQYVGSAYGENGLLGRWIEYVRTQHGNNNRMKELLKADPNRYHQFQFSILQILQKNVTSDEVIALESLYKRKLLTLYPLGMNDN